MNEDTFWKVFAGVGAALVCALAVAWCVEACGGSLAYTPSDAAERDCIEQAEGGAGKAALRKAIDDCRFRARSDGGL